MTPRIFASHVETATPPFAAGLLSLSNLASMVKIGCRLGSFETDAKRLFGDDELAEVKMRLVLEGMLGILIWINHQIALDSRGRI